MWKKKKMCDDDDGDDDGVEVKVKVWRVVKMMRIWEN